VEKYRFAEEVWINLDTEREKERTREKKKGKERK